jgi:hypothetical protein
LLIFLLSGDVNKELEEKEFSTKMIDSMAKLKLNVLDPSE